MTAREKKIARLKRLLADIKHDLAAVAGLATQIKILNDEINGKPGPLADRDMMLMAAYLHHFYTGLESMLERISQNIDGGIGKRGDYHRELLRSMTMEIDGIRPRVITPDLMDELDDYRGFRHMFRHAYAGELRWKKMSHLAENAEIIYSLMETSLQRFNVFLECLVNKIVGNDFCGL